MSEIFGYNKGDLRVSLITSKLKTIDCTPLIETITRKLANWSNRIISYAGQLQLIKSVVLGIQTY